MAKRKSVVRKASRRPASAATMDRVRRMATWLGCLFPLDYPVRVVWSDRMTPGRLGECGFISRQKLFEIRLRKHLSSENALSTLQHEWAHARTMLGLPEGEDFHSNWFYLSLGEIERAWNAGGQRAAARLSF